MKCLAAKLNRTQRTWSVDVSVLADERVPAKPRLDSDLIATSGMESDFYQRRARECFEHGIPTERLLPAWIAGMSFLLNQRFLVPHEDVAPGSFTRIGRSVHDRPVD